MSALGFDAFEEYFYHDLEKGFCADVACCDRCYDDFVATWPHADRADDAFFQTQQIDLDTFYENSWLQDAFSKAEFDHYIKQILCPRCGSPLGGIIWAYNFPFDVPDDFERTIRDVSSLASATPFLLLENGFCRNILSAIRELSTTVRLTLFRKPLFRGRQIKSGRRLARRISTFDRPPAMNIEEGRYNHAGAPVLYLSSDIETCHAELRNLPCLILECKLRLALRVLDLTDPFDSHQIHSDLLNCLVYSALVSAKQSDDGWHRPHYVVSRFVADCARAAGFDAIKYPSTRRIKKNFNIVVLNPSISLATNARAIDYHRMK